jgi:DNA N-6-adenine-methyltransferase (Dam)
MINKGLFTSLRGDWETPDAFYFSLNEEFNFNFDPCSADTIWDGRIIDWQGKRVYCNPAYGRQVLSWVKKGPEAEVAVFNLPSRTDTDWFHWALENAEEIRFIRGRIRFKGSIWNAPFPSVLIIFDKLRIIKP